MRLVVGIAMLLVVAGVAQDAPLATSSPLSPPPTASPAQVRPAGSRRRAAADSGTSFLYKTVGPTELEMTVDYPPGWKATDRRPAIVFFFGGVWTTGSIKEFQSQAAYLAGRGMVAARADYRVNSRQGVTPVECVEDAKSAVRWLRKNAAKLGIDPDRIVAAGGSAGGHIAACTTFTPGMDAPGEDTAISCKANALVLYNPVLDFSDPVLSWRVGGKEAVVRAISPTRQLHKDSPPTLLLFGTDDWLYPQGQEFIRRSTELGNLAEMYTAEGRPHGFYARGKWTDKTTRRVDEFLVSIGYLSAGKD